MTLENNSDMLRRQVRPLSNLPGSEGRKLLTEEQHGLSRGGERASTLCTFTTLRGSLDPLQHRLRVCRCSDTFLCPRYCVRAAVPSGSVSHQQFLCVKTL